MMVFLHTLHFALLLFEWSTLNMLHLSISSLFSSLIIAQSIKYDYSEIRLFCFIILLIIPVSKFLLALWYFELFSNIVILLQKLLQAHHVFRCPPPPPPPTFHLYWVSEFCFIHFLGFLNLLVCCDSVFNGIIINYTNSFVLLFTF